MTIYDRNGNVLYESRKRTIKAALAEAVSAKIGLSNANLRKADLSEANLTGATGIPGVLDWRPAD